MKPEIYTLNGKAILESIKINLLKNSVPVLPFGEDLILSLDKKNDSALNYQLTELLSGEIGKINEESFLRVYLFVDFKAAFPLKDRSLFDVLFERGVFLDFGGGEIFRFLPFLSSQSQSKKCIFAFIREDLFYSLQKRLDLDLPFEKNIKCKSFAFLPKLYAYRALYLSASTEVLRCNSPEGRDFFCPENIIVLPEMKNNSATKVKVFTAKAQETLSLKGEAVLEQEEIETVICTTCFDGEGIITPACAAIINGKLNEEMRGTSFQVRMPFFKGMLHTVDFKKFLADKGIVANKVMVEDAFGIERDILKANIIIRPSVFKLKSLLDSTFSSDEELAEFCGNDIMQYYFDKLHLYNHGLYIVKTESSFKNTKYIRLSAQQLSTFDLKSDDVSGIINEHISMADAFNPDNISSLLTGDGLKIEDKSDWMKLLLLEPRFLRDPHIQSTIKNHRVSRYNDIAQGRILVRGENRFLSGDLYAFLVDIFGMIAKRDVCLKDKHDELKKKRMQRNGIYLPGGAKDGRKVALVRSPHLSRNEDVCTILRYSDEYNNYLGHLTGIAITGHDSYIPAALGGADFDGDHISVIYDKRIIHACCDSGYTEIDNHQSALPFINIKELNCVGKIEAYKYVSSQAVYNTFSNRIGNISNAAMKIAAVEYDKKIEGDNMPSAALCTILTGNEIDATKKGIRPYIDSVLNFSKKLDDNGKYVVNEVENYIKIKHELEGCGGEIPRVKKEGDAIILTDSDLSITKFVPNYEFNAITQLLYRWAAAFIGFKTGTTQNLSKKDYLELTQIFGADSTASDQCEKIIEGFINACDLYHSIYKNRIFIEEATNENTAKAVVRLKGQYDDIYCGCISYKDRLAFLQHEIYRICEDVPADELMALISSIFSTKKDEFNAETFWPYVKNECRNPLLIKILELDFAELLLNFDYEGYRILRYCLNNALLVKSKQHKVVPDKQNPYAVKYCLFCEETAISKKNISAFEDILAKQVKKDLAAVLGVPEKNEGDMIRRIYPLKDTKTTKAFWKIFSERQVINAIRGGTDA